jgi:hypothetical protein
MGQQKFMWPFVKERPRGDDLRYPAAQEKCFGRPGTRAGGAYCWGFSLWSSPFDEVGVETDASRRPSFQRLTILEVRQ